MAMKLYDTKAAELRDFVPIEEGKVGIYVCGPTVQSEPHIGHLRSALVYDLLTRWLSHLGNQVTLIRNVTDIDDKVLEKANEQGLNWWALAHSNENHFATDYRALGMLLPSGEPRATGHIPQMIALIERLIEKGHAYQAEGSSNVYFDTLSWPAYGELTNQALDDMESEGDKGEKRNLQDFALWKATKAGEPESASWQSPWGRGRPGWHIECSAMSTHFLGKAFDIHGGGLDLRFPHHENELAQSLASGDDFANYWIHNGLVNVGGQKMSKSLGNSVSSRDLFALAEPAVIRYYLTTAHYRSVLDYQPSVLEEAASALERLHGFLERCERELGETQFAEIDKNPELPSEFIDEMNDDLNIPAALAVIHDAVTSGNTELDEQQLREAASHRDQVSKMLEILGLAPSQWSLGVSDEHAALDKLISSLIARRDQARENKDYDTADEIRDQLDKAGIELSDGPSGTHWSLS
ncbi:MAG: cysteine--tRNA ligase [Aquiluna sp.]